jgi:hypothetical protein
VLSKNRVGQGKSRSCARERSVASLQAPSRALPHAGEAWVPRGVQLPYDPVAPDGELPGKECAPSDAYEAGSATIDRAMVPLAPNGP